MKSIQKPAVLIDDVPRQVVDIAHSLRVFAGAETQHFFTPASFMRANGLLPSWYLKDDQLPAVAKMLSQYSVVVCDNDFSQDKDYSYPYDRDEKGINFLSTIGPALELLSPEERPLVVCFAPSTEERINENRDRLEKMGILAFHKFSEAALVGLYAALTDGENIRLTYTQFVHGVLGFDESHQTEKEEFGSNLQFTDVLYGQFESESHDQVAGLAAPLEWDRVKSVVAHELHIEKQAFDLRIDTLLSKGRGEGPRGALK